jgi:hypothetical protein
MCDFDPIASLASVTIGMKGMSSPKTMSGAIVIHGFSKAKAFACVTKIAEKHHPDAEVTIDGDVMLVSRGGEARAALTFLDDSTALVVLGPDATRDGVAKVSERRGAPGEYSELIQEINTDDAIWLAVSDGSPMLAEANRAIAKHTSIQVHGLYGSVDFSDGLIVNAGARTGSPELVAKLVSDIQHHIDDHVSRGDLGKRFEQLDVNADGGDVILSLQMSTTQLLALAGEAGSHMHHEN